MRKLNEATANRNLYESRVRKNASGAKNVMSTFIQLAAEALEPIGFVKNPNDASFASWNYKEHKGWMITFKPNFEVDNSFPTYERYQISYRLKINGECQTEEVWVGGNSDELVTDFTDLLNVVAKDIEYWYNLPQDYKDQVAQPAEVAIEEQPKEIYESVRRAPRKYDLEDDYSLERCPVKGSNRIKTGDILTVPYLGEIVVGRVLNKEYKTLGNPGWGSNVVFGEQIVEYATSDPDWFVYTFYNGLSEKEVAQVLEYGDDDKKRFGLKEHRCWPKKEVLKGDEEWDAERAIQDANKAFFGLYNPNRTSRYEVTETGYGSDNHHVWKVSAAESEVKEPNVYIVLVKSGYDGNAYQLYVLRTEHPEEIEKHSNFGNEFDPAGSLAVYQQGYLDGGFDYDEYLGDLQDIIKNNYFVNAEVPTKD